MSTLTRILTTFSAGLFATACASADPPAETREISTSDLTKGKPAPPGPTDPPEFDSDLCAAKACGVPLGMPTILCPDGSLGGNTGRCLRSTTAKNQCHWEIRECPAKTTDPAPPGPKVDPTDPPTPAPVDCTGKCDPSLGMATILCSDGSEAGAVCIDHNGKCGWVVRECPKH